MSERPVMYWVGNVTRLWFGSDGASQTGPDPVPYGTPRPPAKATVIPFPEPDKVEGK